MPKNRKVSKVDGKTTVINTPSKLMIGTRKAGTSAFLMSNKKLLEVLTDSNKKRYIDNARAVLLMRGVKDGD